MAETHVMLPIEEYRALQAELARLRAVESASVRDIFRALPEMHNHEHEAPFAAFVQAMADELRANAHKGDRTGWLTMNEREAVSEVLYHSAKLAYEARLLKRGQGKPATVLEYAADVANCALMVADVCGALTPPEQAHGA